MKRELFARRNARPEFSARIIWKVEIGVQKPIGAAACYIANGHYSSRRVYFSA